LNKTRRELLTGISIAGAGALLIGCRTTPNQTNQEGPAPGESVPAEVTASEDLMREHGVLRRALFVYRESAVKLKQDAAAVPLDALEKTAQLFRVFGEDYHEKKLEEALIFPVLKRFRGPAVPQVDALIAQHARGREITDYILAVSKASRRVRRLRWQVRWSRSRACTSITRRLKTRLSFRRGKVYWAKPSLTKWARSLKKSKPNTSATTTASNQP
jgi:hypothetical protein